MGDRSPKDKQKKKKHHDKEIDEVNRARKEKQQRDSQVPAPGQPDQRKVG